MQVRTLGRLRAYIIAFDMDDNINYNDFHKKLASINGVETWWHYLKSSYLIVTRHSATQLNKEVMKISPGKKMLIVEINIKNRDGYLPKVAWDWLQNITDKLEPPPPSLLF